MRQSEGYIRQADNPGAIINVDDEGLKNYREARRKILQTHYKVEQINNMEQELESLKSELSDLKQLLKKVLESK